MPDALYNFLDVFFFVFHAALVGFNLTGWLWARTRRLHLITMGLTVGSWFGLGAVYGWGYCPCTDWHWDVKRRLGESGLPRSYVKYYLDAATGWDWDPALVNGLVLVLGLGAFGLSVWLNVRDRRRVNSQKEGRPGA